MSVLDWIVLVGTILIIVIYGIWKSRGSKNIEGYLLSDKEMKGWTICLSIMATQASAITFLSTPGQAFDDGMRFIQFYFGLPIAMVIISVVAIPIYHKLNVYTAYQYLENRFDLKTRTFAATLFLISRGLAAGLTIYAPAIILSTILGWNIYYTCSAIGVIVIIYTVAGGTKAVSYTQKQQMFVILLGMFLAACVIIFKLPPDISFMDAVHVAGKMGKLNAITSPSSWAEFDVKDRYNIWSGLIGGTFLALSYFGTDQSQVQRYLGGKTITESRLGLLFNGMLKIPFQFFILFIGVLMFVFYQFEYQPLIFNQQLTEAVTAEESEYREDFEALNEKYYLLHEQKQVKIREMLASIEESDESSMRNHQETILELQQEGKRIKNEGVALIKAQNPLADTNDLDKIFLTFVINYLPSGIVGLLIAVILSASMSSTSAELNALATTSLVDGYKRFHESRNVQGSDLHYLSVSRFMTFIWGLCAIGFALFANRLGNMIQAVNIIGSLFYGTILGIFVVAFFLKKVKGTAVFIAGIIAESIVIACFLLPEQFPDQFSWMDIGFLWYNLIGCLLVVGISLLISLINYPQEFIKGS